MFASSYLSIFFFLEGSTIESTSTPDTLKHNGLVNNAHNTPIVEESTSHKNKSRKISFPSSSSKQHLKQIEDLENQLKERNERIQQLEIELKNSNNEYVEEKNAKNSLVNDLIEKSNIQINLETHVASAQKYIDSSNKKLEAFIIIIQQHLSQVCYLMYSLILLSYFEGGFFIKTAITNLLTEHFFW